MAAAEPALVLLAHGTRDADGPAEIERLAALVRPVVGPVRVAYADVRPPTLADALSSLSGPAVIVPAFLAAGYHVRSDVPAQLAATGRADVRLAEPLGPDPRLVTVAYERLLAAGWTRGVAVVLGAAGSTDERAIADVRRAAELLGERVGCPVPVGFATGTPRAADVVAGLRSNGESPVAVAEWLLAPGRFHRSLKQTADMVADPLGAHPLVAQTILARYRGALG